ncbi:MAG TPA: hypothetical protein V6C84_11335 [Coleofasciculaceae cyanobacterium]|jgi:hypothetical protein
MRQLGLQSRTSRWRKYPCLPRRSSIKTALKLVVKTLRQIKALGAEGGLILFFSARFLIKNLNFSIVSGQLVLSGVPLSIILAFLRDKTARKAYFRKDSSALHDRLCSMGIEERIKDFYRPQLQDELEVDRYIHQLLFERTGYLGKDYQVNSEGILILKKN